jgi:hypothetical protein
MVEALVVNFRAPVIEIPTRKSEQLMLIAS